MKNKILTHLKNIAPGYELDKLPGVLLEAIEEYAVTVVTEEIAKAEDKIIQKVVTEKMVLKVIKEKLEEGARKPKAKRTAAFE